MSEKCLLWPENDFSGAAGEKIGVYKDFWVKSSLNHHICHFWNFGKFSTIYVDIYDGEPLYVWFPYFMNFKRFVHNILCSQKTSRTVLKDHRWHIIAVKSSRLSDEAIGPSETGFCRSDQASPKPHHKSHVTFLCFFWQNRVAQIMN